MIRLDHLTRRFHDIVAVDDVSLEVGEGEVVGFLGPNGAGKSTTIRILTGFMPATSGRAMIGPHDVATDSLSVRRMLGYLPESVSLPLDARVGEYLDFRGRLKGLDTKVRGKQIEKVVGQCGLESVRGRILAQLSRGYRQRVGLADALLGDPPVLLLDEPTAGLDPGQREEVLQLVASLEGERTILLSSHVLAEVEQVSTKIAIIRSGQLLMFGTKAELEASVGGGCGLVISGGSQGSAMREHLQKDGFAVRDAEAGGRIVVDLDANEDSPKVLASLVGAGFPVTQCEPLAKTLHELFLHLVHDAEGAGDEGKDNP